MELNTIYLDNAATSFPKPPEVSRRMCEYLESVGATVNRSVYGAAQEAGLTEVRLRRRLCALFGFAHPNHVILTSGCTMGLNMVLRGLLKPGDHCLVSSMEHNAVMRPLHDLSRIGITFDRISCDSVGRLRPDDVEAAVRPNTKLLVLAHGSNVSGTVQDAETIGNICRAHGVAFCLDAAQTAGHIPVDFSRFQLSALAVPGHKGLLGPSGIGALLLAPEFGERMTPIVSGGTGSASDFEEQPPYMPDRFESGTPNIPGIYGLEAALAFLQTVGINTVASHDRALTARFLEGLKPLRNVKLVGPDAGEHRVGVVSVDFLNLDHAEAADRLEREFGVLTRCGLHCAPSAHRTLGTFPRGTVRFSMSWFTRDSDVDAALAAIRAVSED